MEGMWARLWKELLPREETVGNTGIEKVRKALGKYMESLSFSQVKRGGHGSNRSLKLCGVWAET